MHCLPLHTKTRTGNARRHSVRGLAITDINSSSVYGVVTDVPYCDAFPTARAGWLDHLNEDMKAPDALGYYPPPAHLMRPISPPGDLEPKGEALGDTNTAVNGQGESEDIK